MRILVVGAGAVGQVYGHHLARGGATVGVYVRTRHRAEAEAGYTLTRISLLGRRTTETFRPAFVATGPNDAMRHDVDQVWVCLPTSALEDALLADLGAAAPRATFVVLAPGHFVRARCDAILGARRTVYGVIGMISYHAPLAGSAQPREQSTPEGTAYLLAETGLAGANGRRLLDAVMALRHGGVPVDRLAHPDASIAFGTAALMPHVAALELAGWSFARLGRERAALAARATRESLAIAAAVVGVEPPLPLALIQPAFVAAGAWLAPRVAPLDLERYMRVHFTKVGVQTRLLLSRTIEDAERHGLEAQTLREMVDELGAVSAADGAAPPR